MTAADKTNATKSLLYILSDGKNLPLKFFGKKNNSEFKRKKVVRRHTIACNLSIFRQILCFKR